jgi:hypothetical protein
MRYQINGLTDICTVLSNERKVGGAIEVESIRLRSGETFECAVITGIAHAGDTMYSLGFFTGEGKRFICHVDDISMISDPVHKNICQLCNEAYKELKTAEKLKYLKKLIQVNEDSVNPVFKQEVKQIVTDIGEDAVKSEVDISFLKEQNKRNNTVTQIRIA